MEEKMIVFKKPRKGEIKRLKEKIIQVVQFEKTAKVLNIIVFVSLIITVFLKIQIPTYIFLIIFMAVFLYHRILIFSYYKLTKNLKQDLLDVLKESIKAIPESEKSILNEIRHFLSYCFYFKTTRELWDKLDEKDIKEMLNWEKIPPKMF